MGQRLFPRWCFEGQRNPDGGERPGATPRDDDTDRGGEAMVCVRCRAKITTTGARVVVNGHHEHSCMNPHGYFHHFGCFSSAPGCQHAGGPSEQWSWFPGYTWQLAHCRACSLHVGWRFRSGDHQFHGLICERVVPASDRD